MKYVFFSHKCMRLKKIFR